MVELGGNAGPARAAGTCLSTQNHLVALSACMQVPRWALQAPSCGVCATLTSCCWTAGQPSQPLQAAASSWLILHCIAALSRACLVQVPRWAHQAPSQGACGTSTTCCWAAARPCGRPSAQSRSSWWAAPASASAWASSWSGALWSSKLGETCCLSLSICLVSRLTPWLSSQCSCKVGEQHRPAACSTVSRQLPCRAWTRHTLVSSQPQRQDAGHVLSDHLQLTPSAAAACLSQVTIPLCQAVLPLTCEQNDGCCQLHVAVLEP